MRLVMLMGGLGGLFGTGAAEADLARLEAERPSAGSSLNGESVSARTQDRAGKSRNRHVGTAQSGIASFYWQGQKTANGERFNPNAMTAAHRTLPMGTVVRVTNKRNGNSVQVRINDRGPFIRGRVIDLSRAAAHRIGMAQAGLAPVTIHVIR